jgi:hypothetical protein
MKPNSKRHRRAVVLLASVATALALSLVPAAVAQAGWEKYDLDSAKAYSTDGRAKLAGHVQWYHGSFPRGYLHRGDYSRGATVYAAKRVNCIWAKVTYGYPNGNFTVGPGGPSGGISGGEYNGDGLWVSCRKRGFRKPRRLSLYGVGYAKALLNSTTVQLCTSRRRADGPRYCAFNKEIYGD